MYDIMMQQIKNEVTRLGVKELRTPEEVDAIIEESKRNRVGLC